LCQVATSAVRHEWAFAVTARVQIDPGVRGPRADLSCDSCRCMAAGMGRGRGCMRWRRVTGLRVRMGSASVLPGGIVLACDGALWPGEFAADLAGRIRRGRPVAG